jgi:hypothetical protein
LIQIPIAGPDLAADPVHHATAEGFPTRLDALCADGAAAVYAWCLMDNHLAIRAGGRPLAALGDAMGTVAGVT